MIGLSGKELEVVSFLELNEKFFFSRRDIKRFFGNYNELTVFLFKLRKKGRIVKLNRSKYYLVPVKAFKGHWSEHPFIIIDEIFDGKNYFIGGFSAAHYWKLIDQIPAKTEVYCTRSPAVKEFFHHKVVFKRLRKHRITGFERKEIKGHGFNILAKEVVMEWLDSRK